MRAIIIIVVVALVCVAVGSAAAFAADGTHRSEPTAGPGYQSSEQLEQADERRLGEEDQRIADEVGKAIDRYPFYTIWDEIAGRVDNGIVTLSGRVTPGRDKARELSERIAKVPGVQGVEMDIRMLSPSSGDARIRHIIARRLVSNSHFERFRTMRNPPFHIIVDNSIVTLIGYVQSGIERIELQRVVAQTPGVLRVENQLQALS